MAEAMEAMQAGEYAETIDEAKMGGYASSQGANDLEASVGGSLGISQNRRIEKPSNSEAATEEENISFNVNFNMSVGPIGVEIALNAPISGVKKWGKLKFALSGMFDASRLGFLNNYLMSAVEELIRVIITAVQEEYGHHPPATLKDLEEQLDKAKQRLKDNLMQTTVHDSLWAGFVTTGIAKHGFEVAAEMDLTTKQWTFSLSAVDEIDEDIATSKVKLTRKRQIAQF